MRAIVLTSFLMATSVSTGFSTIPVVDYSAIAHSIYAHAQDYLKEIESTLNQYTMIENQNSQIVNQVTQIAHQVTALERFGSPSYYVNLLHLDQFTSTASSLSQGVGQTIGQFRQTADGVMALGYTPN